MKRLSNKAFTLIELLVVITIIGILATGAVAVYTSQIQKSRDATRINAMESLRGAVEQYYQDIAVYPAASNAFTGVMVYLPKLPSDPKSGQASNRTFFDYTYTVGADANTIIGQTYEISTGFEQDGNNTEKAANTKDNGNNEYRYETGIDVSGLDSGSGSTLPAGGSTFKLCPGVAVTTQSGTRSNPTTGECVVVR